MVDHTKGPWIANGDQVEASEGSNDGYRICDVFGPDQISNASLISASPDLFEASENLLFRIRNIGYWNKPDTEMYIKALEAAVEKARGN